MNINRKQIIKSVLEDIEIVSNLDYQKRVWVRGEGPECYDFDELVCNFYQDGNGVIEKHNEFEITNNQYEILKLFRDEFEVFCSGPGLEYYLPKFFIDTPEWTKIRQRAEEVLKAFNYKRDLPYC